jgi:uncharacterized protein YrrD
MPTAALETIAMQGAHMNGLPVITFAGGERLGAVERTYVDPATKRVIGVGFNAGGGLFTPEISPRLDASRIRVLGPDALLVDDKGAINGEEIDRRFSELTTLDDLVGRAVLTEGGAALGKVAAVGFDPRGFQLTEFEVSRGAMAGTRPLPATHVKTIGFGYIIVADNAWPAEPTGDETNAAGAAQTSAF